VRSLPAVPSTWQVRGPRRRSVRYRLRPGTTWDVWQGGQGLVSKAFDARVGGA